MLAKGPAKKVTIYLNEETRHHLDSLHEAVMTFLLHKGVAGATATRGLAGFGGQRRMHTPKIEALAEHLPIVIEFVDSPVKVGELLPTLYDMVTDGLIEVQDTVVIKSAAAMRAQPEAALPRQRKQGPAKMLRIFFGEADRWHDEPLYEAIVKTLRMMDISGATVYRGILGYGAKGHTHKERRFHRSRDLPVMVSIVDTAERIAQAVEAVEVMLGDGLLVISDVEMVRLVHELRDGL
jgi:PII-like signaling protein